MSDDDRDIDIESDEGEESVDSDTRSHRSVNGSQYLSQAEKRAHHNALERKRRDHIKDSFSSLRDSVPALHGEKVASRAQILKKAAEYIQYMRKKNTVCLQDIDDLRRQNALLDSQIRTLENAKSTGNFAAEASEVTLNSSKSDSCYPRESESDTSDCEQSRTVRHPKKLKVGNGNLH
ncbi:protein max, putative [Pediculus humanus corporis]|uniref:Protein max n=1 Tax=Pediculus humanus subsp. corporis TaxID=121224 RepID=E0VI32_PEDHC|nr:protein max, putative [Pediculus humanus corporis]EEB13038.1 protein max, putative [Pediculus humanus corporis]